jgi:hypothetical protein
MKRILALSLLAVAFAAQADTITIHGPSHHSGNNDTYNNYNWGVGYTDNRGWMVGAFQNSYYETAIYFGKEFMFNRYIGVFALLATGYEVENGHTFQPMAGAVVKIPIARNVTFDISGAPGWKDRNGVIHSSVSFKF